MNYYRLLSEGVPESATIAACLDLLVLRGWWPVRLLAGKFKSVDGRRWITGPPKGTPDYAALHWHYPGFLLEAKRPVGGVLSEAQRQQHHILRAGYHLPIVVCTAAHELKAFLDDWEQHHGPLPRRDRARF